MDHLGRRPVLLQGAIDRQAKVQRLWVVDLVARHHPRAAGARRIKALAFEVLPSPVALDVTRSHVIDHRVAEHVVEGILFGDVYAGLADDHAKLDLPIDLLADRRIDRNVSVWSGDRGDRFGEYGRRFWSLAFGRSLGGVLGVVAADGDDVTPRRVQRREHPEVRQCADNRSAGGSLDLGDELLHRVHPWVA